MEKYLDSARIGDSYRMYIPVKIRKMLELKIGDELAFELDGDKIVVWKNLVTRETVRKLSRIKS